MTFSPLFENRALKRIFGPKRDYLLDPNILLNTLFSNTLNLRSSLNVRDQVTKCGSSGSRLCNLTGSTGTEDEGFIFLRNVG
jgi:hypothetical protein